MPDTPDTQTVAPYGAWKSPIPAEMITSKAIVVRQSLTALDGEDIYWTEARPEEGGRTVLVRRAPDGTTTDLVAPPFNVRSRVHEYGGGEYAVADGVVWFSNFADGRVYRLGREGGEPRPLTPEGLGYRYADFAVDRERRRLIAVREDHGPQGQSLTPTNTLVAFAADQPGEGGHILVSGNDFYAAPRISPDGKHLAYLTWNHPNMPWDGCELWVAPLNADGTVGQGQRVAGGPEESISQPEWSPAGELYFLSDRTGWWNLYRWHEGQAQPVLPMEAEFAAPHWRFGQSTYEFESPQRALVAYTRDGIWHLAHLDLEQGTLDAVETPYTAISQLRVGGGQAVFVGGNATQPMAIVRLALGTGHSEVLRAARHNAPDPGYISVPEEIEYPTAGGKTAHGFYYPPHNRDYTGPANERPPLIVMVHGGPTSFSPATLELSRQFWTSRGFALLDVNYGGSSGYGREYRNRLRGQWGVVDVEDAVHGAEYLAQRGDVDPKRVAITGGSAGGYTTLAALAFADAFAAGSSHFGLSELVSFVKDTHKFESHYLHSLVGPYPERLDLYHERSPMNKVEHISVPLLLFQGLDDKIVPPSQAEVILETLRSRHVPVAYIAFEGEGHGFRKAENIVRTLKIELGFYGRVFGFTPAGDAEEIEIEGLPTPAGKQ